MTKEELWQHIQDWHWSFPRVKDRMQAEGLAWPPGPEIAHRGNPFAVRIEPPLNGKFFAQLLAS